MACWFHVGKEKGFESAARVQLVSRTPALPPVAGRPGHQGKAGPWA